MATKHADSWTLKYAGVILAVGATGAVLIAIASLTFLPERWGSSTIEDAPPDATTEEQLAVDVAKNNAEAEVRDLGLRIALGFGVISGALVAYGRLQLTRAESERSDKSSARSDKGQANERWTTAVEQLGSDHVEVRLGGVYALEQFYGDVPDERLRTTSVLAAFVRANLPPNKPLPDVPEARRPAPLPPDIQAALTVLGGLAERPPTDLSRIDTSVEARYRAVLTRANLSGADMTGANLTGANLTETNLTGANLTETNLTETNLTKANLTGSNLTESNLAKATLTEATLSRAYLTGANLSGATLREATLSRAYLTGADLYRATLRKADLHKTTLDEANLTEANLGEANLAEAGLKRADMTGANLYRANLSEAVLTRANLTRANLAEADLTRATLRAGLHKATLGEANLTEADMTRANLTDANLTDANLTDANLTDANLTDANLTESVLTGATGRNDWDELVERGAIRNEKAHEDSTSD